MRFVKITPLLYMLTLVGGAVSQGFSQDVHFNDSIKVISSKSRPEPLIQKLDLSNVHFEKAINNRVNFGLSGSGYKYILLKLNSSGAHKSPYLSIDNTSLDTLCVYRVYHNGKSEMVYSGGILIPFNTNNKYVWHTVPVELNNISSYYLIALKSSYKNINVKYEVLPRDQLQQKYQVFDRLVFFYIGIVCLIIIIILLALFLFKKKAFAAYLGYILSALTWILSHYGYIFPYVYAHFPVINEIVKPISSVAAGFFLLIVMSLVFRQQIQLRKRLRRVIKTMQYILPVIIVSMFLLLIPELNYILKTMLIAAWHTGLIFTLCLVVLTPISFIRSGPTAKIFSSAMFVICTMTLIQLLANSGFINNIFIEEHGITMGSLLENIIIAFGLFYNLLQERKQREEQVLALELEQAETLKKLITVQNNERKRIAGDLHDNIGPLLAALKINFRRIINMKERSQLNGLASKTEAIIDDSIAEIHNVALNLMPKGLSSNGLINTLKEYFDSIQQLYNKKILFHHNVESILNPELQINIYRIICELVLNSARHSAASNITVNIDANEKSATFIINDDGKGFQIRSGDNKNSLGLQNAESRVLYLKGVFNLQTEAGKGTQIAISIPLQCDDFHVNGL